MLKDKLLSLQIVEDNRYLDLYVELIQANSSTSKQPFKTQEHHIVPVCYYTRRSLEVDNSKSNLVNLTHYNHALAHYYLCLCSIDVHFRYANENALIHMLNIPKLNLRESDIFQLMDKYSIVYEQFLRDMSEAKRGSIPWNKGLPMSESTKIKLSAIHRGVKKSPESVAKRAASMVGKNTGGIYVNNGACTRHIKEDELTDYLDKGYTVGNPGAVAGGKSFKGKVTVYKDSIERRIHPEELSTYISMGYTRGRAVEHRASLGNGVRGKPSWNKGKQLSEEHKEHLRMHSTAGRILVVNKDGCIKKIRPEQLNDYIENGFKQGRIWRQ